MDLICVLETVAYPEDKGDMKLFYNDECYSPEKLIGKTIKILDVTTDGIKLLVEDLELPTEE